MTKTSRFLGSPPEITVVVPMLNEEHAIESCLRSILQSWGPGDGIELLVVDGGSTDASRALVLAMGTSDPRVRLIDNPLRVQSAAFNIAVGMARAPILARVDAHAIVPDNYLHAGVLVLEESGAANAGGPVVASGRGHVGQAIAAAYTSPFGLGHTRHDPSLPRHDVDSVSFGIFRTAVLRQIGGMDPAAVVNEDYELNWRLRQAGHRVVWDPQLRATYFVRESLSQLWRQYFRYGMGKALMLHDHPRSVRFRQLVAPAFVLSILVTPLLVKLAGPLGWVHLGLYAVANLLASVAVASRCGWQTLVLLPLVFTTMHTAWGTGFLRGVLGRPRR